MRFQILLLVAISIAVIGAGTCWAAVEDSVQQSNDSHRQFRFEGAGSGRGAKKDGTPISFDRYKAQDGVVVVLNIESYKTSDQASAALEKLAGTLGATIHRGVKRDWKGHIIGQRIQMVEQRPKRLHTVAWVSQSTVTVLRSRSLEHILDFEQQTFPAVPPTVHLTPKG